MRVANPGRAVEVWAEDEARLGLKPLSRRACGRTKYEWRYVYAFARPATGQTFTTIRPRVKVGGSMAEALEAFAAHADPDRKKLLVLVLDRAGRHRAKRLSVPANARLHFLPACTPQLQPVEPFWPLVREAVANDTFDALTDLRQRVARRCQRLAADRATVKGAIGFRWAVNLEK